LREWVNKFHSSYMDNMLTYPRTPTTSTV
jgi:hypothetical protein